LSNAYVKLNAPLKSNLRVVVANIERGRRVLEWAQLLETLKPDIVLINEADYGMARSGNAHIARVLAARLGMNYAWGLEYVELTPGTAAEHKWVKGLLDSKFLTGNAILSKFKLHDPKVFRDPIGPYFSLRANSVNAGGYERRLGGRMGLFAKINFPAGGSNHEFALGSVHKLGSVHAKAIRQYLSNLPAIVGGDQPSASCASWGLRPAGNLSSPTWPATCTVTGRGRGDVVCTSLEPHREEVVGAPCVRLNGISVALGDHAYIVQDLEFEPGRQLSGSALPRIATHQP